MGVLATIPQQFLDRNLRMSDSALRDGFGNYDSELLIASLHFGACSKRRAASNDQGQK
jgi:hypothetical protein